MKELDTDDPLPDEDEFREVGFKPLSNAAAHAIYLILVNVCGALLINQDQFMCWATFDGLGDEYRFCGIFGLSGKIWIKRDQWYVTGPNSNEILSLDGPRLNDSIADANYLLRKARARYVAGHLR